MTITKEQRELIKRKIMPGSSDDDLELFIGFCNRYDLDPFAKQCSTQPYKNKDGSIKWNFSIDRDGYLKIANRNPNFLGLVSASIYSKDIFEADIGTGTVKHIIKIPRGDLVGAWAKAQVWNPIAKCPNLLLIAVDSIANHIQEISSNDKVNFWRDETEKMIIKEPEKMVLKKVVPIEDKQDSDSLKDIPILPNELEEKLIPDQKQEKQLILEDQKHEKLEIEMPQKSIEKSEVIELPPIELLPIEMETKITLPEIKEPEKISSKKKTSKKDMKELEKAEKKQEAEKQPVSKTDIVEIHYASDEEPSLNDFPTQVLFAVIEESFKSSSDLINMIENAYKSNIQKKPKTQSCLFYAITIVKNNLETQQITDIDWYEKFQSRMTRIINGIKTDVVPMLKTEQTELQQRDIIQKITGYDDFQIEWVLRFVKTL